MSILLLILVAIITAVLALVLVKPLRIKLISFPTLKRIHRLLPSLSETEKEAMEAGSIWWEGELFRGKPEWKHLHKYAAPTLTKEEQSFIDGPVNTVCAMVNDFQVTHQHADLPDEVWQYLKQEKFFALIIKKQYGGLEFSPFAQSIILQKLSGVSTILSITVGVPNSLGPGELLQHYGTEEQKNHYLPRLAAGDEIPCFALTSPEAGSDATSIPDTGVITKGIWKGETILGIRLNWNKRYITLAPVATLLGLAFKLYDPEHHLGEKEDLGITCALIPTTLDGIKIGRRHFPLNVPFQNGPTQGTDVFIPLDYIIGGANNAGHGWKMLVECLSVGRGITLPSNSTGIVKSTAMAIGAYAYIRRQFKQPIGRMEGVEEPLARITGYAYSMDAACRLTMSALMTGEKPAIVSAIVKYHCTERAQTALKDAMDISGGKGICLGPNNFLARHYQGAPIAITVEGANILTRSLIIFGQGATRCHPYLLDEIRIAESYTPELSLERQEQFDALLMQHGRYVIRNAWRSLVLGFSDGRGSSSPFSDSTKRYYQRLNRYSANLAFLTDFTLFMLGGNLKKKERLSARLADVLSHLYLASAVLKRYDDDGRTEKELPLLDWTIQDCLYQIEQAFVALMGNFSSPLLRRVMRFWIMPLGTVRHPPSDRVDHQLAQIIQTHGVARAQIGRNQYLVPTASNPTGQINEALKVIKSVEPIFQKIESRKGKKLAFRFLDQIAQEALDKDWIDVKEYNQLVEAESTRLMVINVDDFHPDAISR